MSLPIFQIDAFTDTPFAGNPATVVILEGPAKATWMQRVAAEMNLSETAFVELHEDHIGLRWFTPLLEVDLCGHATLAAAHALWQTQRAEGPIAFHTRSGVLTARQRGPWIELDFPADEPQPTPPPPGIADALGVKMVHIRRGVSDFLVEVESAEVVRQLIPDFARLARIEARGFIITAPSDDDRYDFISRFFAPRFGINEDPVTGSAHCTLSPYWSEKLDDDELVGYQASPRGGFVRTHRKRDRVVLSGQAVTVLAGELTVD
ncbi:MAG: PhzF family phenazine biosynthesis isomerase [Planctomycetes bacterium]|nr:PhzF family phenazine biosynthesis isomerase [Planctomycetota bacterium]